MDDTISIPLSQLRYCRRPPSQGGLSRTQVNQIALQLGLDPKQFSKKDDLCTEILKLIHISPSSTPSSSPSSTPTPIKSETITTTDGESPPNLEINNKLINQLKEVAEYYERIGEIYRNKALLQAINIISAFPHPIINPTQQLKGLKGIGKGTIDRISEFLSTGTIEELKKIDTLDQRRVIINQLTTVFGIGAATADRLIDRGITSVTELREKVEAGEIKLTDHQTFGLEYYHDLQQRIPRNEVTFIGGQVLSSWSQLNTHNIGEIVGSYRRGRDTSGDIDILVSNTENQNHLGALVDQLTEDKLIERTLSFGKVKFMGTYISPTGLMRKIDIRYVPPESWPTALLHSTGSDQFNVLCRKQAIELGMSLSEFGLFKVIPINTPTNHERIVVTSEQDVLTILNLDPIYINPENRNI